MSEGELRRSIDGLRRLGGETEMNHAPLPWKIATIGKTEYIVCANGRSVATVRDDDGYDAFSVRRSDAALIVAAVNGIANAEEFYTNLLVKTRKVNDMDLFAAGWSRFIRSWIREIRELLGRPINP